MGVVFAMGVRLIEFADVALYFEFNVIVGKDVVKWFALVERRGLGDDSLFARRSTQTGDEDLRSWNYFFSSTLVVHNPGSQEP